MSRADSPIKRYQVLSLTVAACSILAVSLWGGMLYDRVDPRPELSGTLNLAGFPVSAMLSVSALAVALWFDPTRWKVGLVGLAVGGLLAWTAASMYVSPHLHASLVTFAILSSSTALGWAIFAARLPLSMTMWLALALVTASSIVAGLGISEYIAHITRIPRDVSWRVFSTLATPNFLAGYLVMTIPITASSLLASRERMVRLLCGMGLALQLACILLTGSRFGLLCLAIAVSVTGALSVRRGLVAGLSGRRGRLAGAIILAVALLGSIPVGIRLFRTSAESHSSQFRFFTWKGTAKMATANPLLGTGLGSFDAAHAPYSEVAYTQHAHNTYLQLAAESGFPALILLLLIMGSALSRAVSAARVVPVKRESSEFEEFDPIRTAASGAPTDHAAVDSHWTSASPGLLAAGAAGGIAGAIARNLFDSDLYVPAIAFTFALLCGIAASLASADESAEPEPSAVRLSAHRMTGALGWILGALFLTPYSIGRLYARAGEVALRSRDGQSAVSAYESAARWDFLEAEYRLKLASLREASGTPEAAPADYLAAVSLLRTGKPRYQFAQYYRRQGRNEPALHWYEEARKLEPNNLQNLLALAESYRSSSREADSERTYRRITFLYDSPYGRVRAIPELVEFEFGEAIRALGEIALDRSDKSTAELEYRKAVEILQALWGSRKNPMVQIQVRPEKMIRAGEQLLNAQTALGRILADSGRTEDSDKIRAETARTAEEISAYRAESAEAVR